MNNSQQIENKAHATSRTKRPAEKILPLVRQMICDDFALNPNSEQIARRYGFSRLDIEDVVLSGIYRQMRELFRRFGLNGGMGKLFGQHMQFPLTA